MSGSNSIRPIVGRIFQSHVCSSITAKHGLAIPIITSKTATSTFSTTSALQMRKPRRDNNRLRGVSSLYRSGTKGRMAVDGIPVPEPSDYDPTTDVKTDPDHGLWQFFYNKEKALLPPEEESQHGRSWTVEELRHKSWDDLHRLWWVCVKERNRIATAARERRRLEFKTGDDQSVERMRVVSQTMKSIKHALTERFYTWEDARTLAETDPEVDLSGEGRAYNPQSYLVEDAVDAVPSAEEQSKSTENIDSATLPKVSEITPVMARS
ncbi:mitochondrial 39-S ribosomal protein L47 (MRP-L47)-domain-containing protein [Xylariales sp. PMI_506]|nr:mitochondrial 39-S ribosomal protein L47 (MRP-L47)-domain-containing protein [Xylariales sp. PMI_506]